MLSSRWLGIRHWPRSVCLSSPHREVKFHSLTLNWSFPCSYSVITSLSSPLVSDLVVGTTFIWIPNRILGTFLYLSKTSDSTCFSHSLQDHCSCLCHQYFWIGNNSLTGSLFLVPFSLIHRHFPSPLGQSSNSLTWPVRLSVFWLPPPQSPLSSLLLCRITSWAFAQTPPLPGGPSLSLIRLLRANSRVIMILPILHIAQAPRYTYFTF